VTAGALNVTGASILQLGVTAGSLYVTGSSIFGGTVTSGAMNINNTSNAVNGTSGGAFTVVGGAAIGKSLFANTVDITPSLGDISKELSFSASNNVLEPQDVTNFVFSNSIVRSFNALVSVSVVRSVGLSLYTTFEIKGLQKTNGWVINTSFIGDVTDIEFSMTAGGQIQYTSPDIANWVSTIMKFRALTTSV
jgi:hypothetical protein